MIKCRFLKFVIGQYVIGMPKCDVLRYLYVGIANNYKIIRATRVRLMYNDFTNSIVIKRKREIVRRKRE